MLKINSNPARISPSIMGYPVIFSTDTYIYAGAVIRVTFNDSQGDYKIPMLNLLEGYLSDVNCVLINETVPTINWHNNILENYMAYTWNGNVVDFYGVQYLHTEKEQATRFYLEISLV